MIKKELSAVMAAMLIMTGCAAADQSADTSPAPLTAVVRTVSKHGNLILDASFDDMKRYGIGIGDIITVRVGENVYEMPVGTDYTDVDSGEMLCRFDLEDNDVMLGMNYGSFAEASGAAEKQPSEEDPGFIWDIRVTEVVICLKEKEGYLDEYSARNLTRTNERSDYPELSDEEFANFRAVSVTGVGGGILYRSSSPIDPSLGRNEYAMAAMEKYGIRSVINLVDSAENMKSSGSFPGSFYSGRKIINPEMSYDFESAGFGEKIRECAAFIAENEGPYLIHCKEGKDRTGILCAVLECFAGATADEIGGDYMTTYTNFYKLKPSDAAYDIILGSNLMKTLSALFGIDGVEGADLKKEAESYLISVGVTAEQLSALEGRLSGRQTAGG